MGEAKVMRELGDKLAKDAEDALNDPAVPNALTTSLARGNGPHAHLAFLLTHGRLGVWTKAAMSAADLRALGAMCFRMAEALERPEPRKQ